MDGDFALPRRGHARADRVDLRVERVAEDAIDALYKWFLGRVRNKEDAEDLTQETFARAAKSFRTFDANRELQPWLFGIAKHVLASHFASLKKQELVRDALGTVSLRMLIDPGQDRLPPEFSELPQSYQEVLLLREVLGFNVRETANVLGIKISACKMRYVRALKRWHALRGDDPDA